MAAAAAAEGGAAAAMGDPSFLGTTLSSLLAADAMAIPSWTLLALALYWWQLPHFFALSYMHRKDYARGGFQMVSGTPQDLNGDLTARYIVRYSAYMSVLPFLSTGLGYTTSMFTLEGLVLNGFALRAALRFHKDRSNANARRVFLTSLGYLPCWLMLFLLHSKGWDKDDDKKKIVEGLIRDQAVLSSSSSSSLLLPPEPTEENASVVVLAEPQPGPPPPQQQQQDDGSVWTRFSSTVRGMRSRGRELCLHEARWAGSTPGLEVDGDCDHNGAGKCPIVVGRCKTQEGVDAVRAVAETTASAAAQAAVDAAAGGPPLPLVPTAAAASGSAASTGEASSTSRS
jgi:hypothetical protein